MSRDRVAAVSANGFLVVAGGLDAAQQPSDELRVYSIVGDAWSVGKPMPTPRGSAAFGVATGRLYVAGGEDATGLDVQTTERYNIGGESWQGPALPAMPAPHCCGASASDGTRLYVAGGRAGAKTLRSYAPAEGLWRDHAPMDQGRSHPVAELVAGVLVVGLGATAETAGAPVLASFEAWSPEADAWQALPDAPAGRVGADSAAWGDRLVIAGGLDSAGEPTKDVWVLDLSLGWVAAPSLPVARAYHALLQSADGLWVLGGRGAGGAYLTTLEHLPLAAP